MTMSIPSSIFARISATHEMRVVFAYDVFAGSNNYFGTVLKPATKVLFALDSSLSKQLQAKILGFCSRVGINAVPESGPLWVPSGENAKDGHETAMRLCEEFLTAGLCRHSAIVAIGGGAVLDTVGFAAAITHRGIPIVRMPTTVLGQSDAGVGIKNAINFLGRKNALGTFAPPKLVLNDLSFLETLPADVWTEGFAEAVKVALIKDGDFFSRIERFADTLVARDMGCAAQVIRQCASLHVEHIANFGDPFEMQSGRPLDFGHWIAHRIERLTNWSLRHGAAVSVGMAVEVRAACLRGVIYFWATPPCTCWMCSSARPWLPVGWTADAGSETVAVWYSGRQIIGTDR